MLINFNINDASGSNFITASRWNLNDQVSSDDHIVKVSLKQYIGSIIDTYNAYLAVGVLQASASLLSAQYSTLLVQLDAAVASSQSLFANTYVPTNMGATP